ncbi:rod shape-determining protein RodA [Geobacter metallireducens RCH3]|uniref:Peptidoglycan glycosyltransferase RodA n=1 Tax=Geobacter metallireducens (strain ATCC 53774 / DSM 7210 / GS-15) TaxID=269799 RepID=Q39X53_GEOMG|nr:MULTISPECIES: rod shape-determining protein RodA [Geobacter]ABB31171.1 cell shape-determining protein RodA [Geobacter metallireducens GS-15]EHP85349.1 rod shape-determining protein RodA [Geobacter metallireducens RCH3]MBT1075234.1 rod shape-determining protein RodA [Geobacter grbiciae]
MIDRRLFTNFDWTLLVLVFLISAMGIVNIYSASASYTLVGAPYYLKQFYWIVAGMFLVVLACSVDYHLLEDVTYWFYGLLCVVLVAVLLMGKTSMGATRWLHLGFFSIQPSEPMKVVMIMTLARFLSRYPAVDGLTVRDLVYPLLFVGGPAILIMKQPDLGTAIVIILIACSMIAYVGVRLATLVACLAATVPAIYLGWRYYLRDYQKNRILNFLNPERDPLGSGYHIIQSKIAVGSGGIFGKGFTHGTQTQLRFLPEQHTDFAFSVFGEEWGFIGCLTLLLLYLFLIFWGLHIAGRCNDRFGSLMAVGVTAMLFWHTIINIGMVIGVFPVVGVPLPLFSYGGTSMITSMIGVGVLLNISMRRFMF